MPSRHASTASGRGCSVPRRTRRRTVAGRRPTSPSTISVLPAPTRPPMPRISPGATSKDTSCTGGPKSRGTDKPSTAKIGGAVGRGRSGGNRSSISRPIMADAMSCSDSPAAGRSSVIAPSRKTATRSEIARTSSSRCEVKMTEPPSSAKARIRANSASVSRAPRTAVGSSISKSRGRAAKALASSTICQLDTGRPAMQARGSMSEFSSRSASRAAARMAA